MIVYLASPASSMQASHLCGMPTLISFGAYRKSIDDYWKSFERILIDSGAFSEFASGKKIDLSEYQEWVAQWTPFADAVAGLDDIRGNWRRSLKNYMAFSGGFPTFHESDPPEFLDDLIQLALERKQWLGIGLLPPRNGKEHLLRKVLDRIPEQIHVHGWALRGYTHISRLDSVDSTNWWRDAVDLKKINALRHLTYSECIEIVVKRYKRWKRVEKKASKIRGFDL